ncbi:MAG: CDP-alcohol phosphatidyltransferase family protein [Clostridia bacterium]|nr:CDP-alcohol phosphatidyltransferase family protein [Clostridia bacterium]
MAESRPDNKRIWTVPNVLTMLRMALIPVYWVLMSEGKMIPALCTYIVASLTDVVDGYIARKYNQITDFGKLMDPLADKLMVLSVMLSMIIPMGGRPGILPLLPFVIVLAKELLMVLGGLVLYKKGIVVYSKIIGKAAQVLMVSALLLSFFYEYFDSIAKPVYLWVLWAAVVLTVCALCYYAADIFRQLREQKAKKQE